MIVLKWGSHLYIFLKSDPSECDQTKKLKTAQKEGGHITHSSFSKFLFYFILYINRESMSIFSSVFN